MNVIQADIRVIMQALQKMSALPVIKVITMISIRHARMIARSATILITGAILMKIEEIN